MPNKRSGITRQSEEADRLLGKTEQQRFLKVKTNQQKEAEKKGNMTTYLTIKITFCAEIQKAKLHCQVQRKMPREDKNV